MLDSKSLVSIAVKIAVCGFALCMSMSAASGDTLAGDFSPDSNRNPQTIASFPPAEEDACPPPVSSPAHQKTPKTAPQTPEPSEATSPEAPTGFRVGADLYVGVSNTTGRVKIHRDGIWDGSGPFYPSLLSLDWRNKQSHAFRLSVGIGELYTERAGALHEPIEAYFQSPLPRGDLTLGKFYVPFAGQEWEYETKWGMMYQGEMGQADLAGAVTANPDAQAVNAYLRVGRSWHSRTAAGISLGLGRGLFYNSSHHTGLGLDMSHDFGRIQFRTEYAVAFGPNGMFQSLFGKLTLPGSGNLIPYIGAYYRHDQAGEQDNFHSYIAGASYRLTSFLTLEGAYARANDRNVFWMQMHFIR